MSYFLALGDRIFDEECEWFQQDHQPQYYQYPCIELQVMYFLPAFLFNWLKMGEGARFPFRLVQIIRNQYVFNFIQYKFSISDNDVEHLAGASGSRRILFLLLSLFGFFEVHFSFMFLSFVFNIVVEVDHFQARLSELVSFNIE